MSEKRKVTDSDIPASSAGVDATDSLYVYLILRFDAATSKSDVVAWLADDAPPASLHEYRNGGFGVEVTRRMGTNREERALLDALLRDARDVLALAARRGLGPRAVTLQYVHTMSIQFQGHGLEVPDEWVRLLASHNGNVDIDQYVSGGEG